MKGSLVLPYPPSSNRYWRLARGHLVPSEEAKAYKLKVRWLCLGAKVRPELGEVAVMAVFYRPQKSGDLDNRLKVLLDSLNGLAWADDAQVVEIHARRCDDRANPRVELRILTVETGALVTAET